MERNGVVKRNLIEKIKESLSSVLPITIIVFLLTISIVSVSGEMFFMFGFGAVMLILGIGLFTLGADLSMIIIGEKIGSNLTKLKKLYFILPVVFFIGVLITVAEPDLKVLAEQAPLVDTKVLIWSVGIGVGLFLVISFLRIFFQIKLSYIFLLIYLLIFIVVLSPLVDEEFIPIAFDSGGVTTGPMTVPFIMALGLGLSNVRGDKTQQDDSFGLVALSSVGPIATVVLIGVFNKTNNLTADFVTIKDYNTVGEVFGEFIFALPHYFKDVAWAIVPVVVFFLIYNAIALKLDIKILLKIFIGLIYTYLGLVIFLTGVNVGFMPVGQYIGESISTSDKSWLLIPIGMIIGYFIVAAEPAVHLLKQQVEEITEGAISGKSLSVSLAIGVSISVGISMLRVITGISIIWFLIPGYLFAIIMTFFVPTIFTAVAFDAGGVASGPMTATFLLPLSLGACRGVGGNISADAFGVVAMVAMTPLITIQLLGLISIIKEKRSISSLVLTQANSEDIIILDDAVAENPVLNSKSDELVLFELDL